MNHERCRIDTLPTGFGGSQLDIALAHGDMDNPRAARAARPSREVR